ncbi:hypothetical protein N2152v2_008169 [Parachlorella kessleri]
MGQYLSAPVTDKEDAHITELDLEPNTRTALFSIFDGHGGKAVAKFCARHLAQELLTSPAYKRGDLRQAVADAYYRLDVLLDSEEGRAELANAVGGTSKNRGPPALFAEVEEGLEVTDASEESDVPHELGGGGPSAAASDGLETQPLASSSPASPRTRHAAGGAPSKKDLKKTTSQQFLASHLMRASVLPPGATAGVAAARGSGGSDDSEAAAAAANGVPSAPVAAVAAAVINEDPGVLVAEGDAQQPQHDAADDGGTEEEEEQHAAGMGCTAVSVIVRGDTVVVANTGDSRCVLSRKGQAIALTLDHKPILFEEARRIIKAGGFVRDNRINGALNVSRTIGDLDFKRNSELPPHEQMVVATPDVETFCLRDGDEFIVLACDGIWDVMSNQEAVDYVRKRIKSGVSLQQICESMCDACLAPDLKGLCRGADNMSVIIILFRKHANLGGWWNRLLTSMCNFKTPSLHRKR